jgi:hypothetical protein
MTLKSKFKKAVVGLGLLAAGSGLFYVWSSENMIEYTKLSNLFNRLTKETPNKAPVVFYSEKGTPFGMAKLPRPLDLAIRARDKDQVLSLLAAGADPNLTTDFSGPALNEAVDINDPEMVKILLQHKADVNKANTAGSTPMHRAVSPMFKGDSQNLEIIKLLLAQDPDLHAKNCVRDTPLAAARRFGQHEAIKLMQAHIEQSLQKKKASGPKNG